MTITPSRLTENNRPETAHHHRLLVRTRPGAVCPVACPGARPENHRHCVPGEAGADAPGLPLRGVTLIIISGEWVRVCCGFRWLPVCVLLPGVPGCIQSKTLFRALAPFGSPSVPAGSSGPHSANPAAGRRLSSAEPAARFRAAPGVRWQRSGARLLRPGDAPLSPAARGLSGQGHCSVCFHAHPPPVQPVPGDGCVRLL